jgi:hypothetical protein
MGAQRWAQIGLGLALGVVLLVLAVPRVIAGWETNPAGRPLKKIFDAQRPTTDELREGVEGLRRSVAVIGLGRRLVELGTMEFLQTQEMFPSNPGRLPLLKTAETHLLEGLADNPVDGTGWYRLAQVRDARGASPREIVIALMQSLDMAPNMRWLWLVRARLFYANASALLDDELLAVRSQLRVIWNSDPKLRQLLFYASTSMKNEQLLSTALQEDPEATAELEKLRRATAPK